MQNNRHISGLLAEEFSMSTSRMRPMRILDLGLIINIAKKEQMMQTLMVMEKLKLIASKSWEVEIKRKKERKSN